MLDKNGEMKEDVNLPAEEHLKPVVAEIKRIFEEGKKECLVTVLTALGKQQVIECREGSEVWGTKINGTARIEPTYWCVKAR